MVRRPPSWVIAASSAAALAGCALAGPTGPASSEPSGATAAATATPDPFGGALPLPAMLLPVGEFVVHPRSHGGLTEGVPVPFTLDHCGLSSPVDVDGSLWQPMGGADSRGGPIDSEEEVGDLINDTPGIVMLVTHDRLDYRSEPHDVWVALRRLPGAGSYPGCA